MPASCLPRQVLDALLRHSDFKNGKLVPPGKFIPTMANLSSTFAARLSTWIKYLNEVLAKEERGELIDDNEPWLHEWVEGMGMREIVDRLNFKLPEIQFKMRNDGFGGLTVTERVGLLHILIEQVLQEDKDIHKRMEPQAISDQRANLLGKDQSGRWHYHLPTLEDRVYSMASPWQPKPLPAHPHLVRPGDRVEVEVNSEEEKGKIEWRGAKVLELLPGGKGRFRVMVDAPNGEPDEEFIETFTSPLMGKEWRKIPKKEAPPPPPKPEPPPPPPKAPGRKTRVSEGDEGKGKAGPVSKKAKLTPQEKEQKIEEDRIKQLEQVALMSTAEDGKSIMLCSKTAAGTASNVTVGAVGGGGESSAAAAAPPAVEEEAKPKGKGKGGKKGGGGGGSAPPKENKLDAAVREGIESLKASQETHASAYDKVYQDAVIRLYHQMQQAEEDLKRLKENPPPPPTNPAAAAAASSAVPGQPDTSGDSSMAQAVAVAQEMEKVEKAQSMRMGRAERSAKREAIAAAEFAEREAKEKAEAEERRKRKLEAKAAEEAGGSAMPSAVKEEPAAVEPAAVEPAAPAQAEAVAAAEPPPPEPKVEEPPPPEPKVEEPAVPMDVA